jgi:MYXO-CTERM domain-containing protein
MTARESVFTMRWSAVVAAAVGLAGLVLPVTAHGTETLVDLAGDCDGFGSGLPYSERPEYWNLAVDEGTAQDRAYGNAWCETRDFEWTHTYDFPDGAVASGATLQLNMLGSDDANPALDVDILVFVDGVEIPNAFDDAFDARGVVVGVFDVPAELVADGQVVVTVDAQGGSDPDCIFFDYSELVIEYTGALAVPSAEPGVCFDGVLLPVCGDSNTDSEEECDDGPTGSDTCTPACTLVACGDNVCTDTVESAASCPEDCAPVCGDSAITHAEVCDGADLGGQDCTDLGYTTPAGVTCDSDCGGIDSSACAPVCGDSNLEPGEACDDGPTGSDTCTPSCTFVTCGDDVCTDSAESAASCPEDCAPVCGAGGVTHAEVCDGADFGGQDCTDLGYTTPAGLTCDGDCGGIDSSACAPVCGDGSIEPGEACDDTNTAADDGCSATCQVEDGWGCSGATCAPVCGDGLVTGDEQCDDGELASGDGCDADCAIEDFFACDDGEPTLCDPDGDEDGIADDDDNCPDDANADQVDTDDDGVGDDCEEADTSDPDTDLDTTDSDVDIVDLDSADPDIEDTGFVAGGSCGCSSTGTPVGALGLIGLVGLVLRRRR